MDLVYSAIATINKANIFLLDAIKDSSFLDNSFESALLCCLCLLCFVFLSSSNSGY